MAPRPKAEGSVLATILLAWPLPASLLFVYPGKWRKNQKVLLPPPYSSNPTAFRAFGGREFSKKEVIQNFLCRNQSGNPAGLQKERGLSKRNLTFLFLFGCELPHWLLLLGLHFFSLFLVCVCMLSHFGAFETPWTLSRRAPLSMGFSRQEYWSELPCPPSGDLPDLGTEPVSPVSNALKADIFPPEPLRKSPWIQILTLKGLYTDEIKGPTLIFKEFTIWWGREEERISGS